MRDPPVQPKGWGVSRGLAFRHGGHRLAGDIQRQHRYGGDRKAIHGSIPGTEMGTSGSFCKCTDSRLGLQRMCHRGASGAGA